MSQRKGAAFCRIPKTLLLLYTTSPFKVCCINTIPMIIKRFLLSLYYLLCILILAGCSEGQFTIKDAWIAEAPPGVVAQAGYLTLDNDTSKPMTLVSVTSDTFEEIQIHRSTHNEATGLVTMIHEGKAAIPAHKTLQFKPGDYHLMLMKPKSALKEGDQVVMRLIFANDTEYKITFAVRREKFSL